MADEHYDAIVIGTSQRETSVDSMSLRMTSVSCVAWD